MISCVSSHYLTSQKLFGKGSDNPSGNGLSGEVNTSAISTKWILIGALWAAERGHNGVRQIVAGSVN